MELNTQNLNVEISTTKYVELIRLNIAESNDYNLTLPNTDVTKVICICCDENSVDTFNATLNGNTDQSILLQTKSSHITLHAQGDKWVVAGSRHVVLN